MFFGQGQTALRAGARLRVGIGAATDGDQRGGLRKFLFQTFLGVTGPVAAELIDLAAECRAMPRVIAHDRTDFSVPIDCPKNWKRVIDRTARGSSVCREINLGLTPGELAATTIFQGLNRDRFQLV